MFHALILWDEPDDAGHVRLRSCDAGGWKDLKDAGPPVTRLLARFRRDRKCNLRFQIYNDKTFNVVMRGKMK
jgi:hypothetical protein